MTHYDLLMSHFCLHLYRILTKFTKNLRNKIEDCERKIESFEFFILPFFQYIKFNVLKKEAINELIMTDILIDFSEYVL